MAKIYPSADALVGNTPLLELNRIRQVSGLSARILAKLEFYNVFGSVKDRVAKAMLDAAEKRGELQPGGTIIEATSGNTGISLSALAAARGYKCIIVMPDNMSSERRLLMQAYGANVVLTPGKTGMAGAIAQAHRLQAAIPGSFIPHQFENPANPAIHASSTGPEIWADSMGNVDIFVAGAGTGGTVSGIGRFLKSQNPHVRIVAVEPAASPVLSSGQPGNHGIQGIGAGFVPKILDMSVIDEIIPVTDRNALETARHIAKTEGLCVGISAGAAAFSAILLAKRPENAGKTIVTLFPDSGERYLSTELFV